MCEWARVSESLEHVLALPGVIPTGLARPPPLASPPTPPHTRVQSLPMSSSSSCLGWRANQEPGREEASCTSTMHAACAYILALVVAVCCVQATRPPPPPPPWVGGIGACAGDKIGRAWPIPTGLVKEETGRGLPSLLEAVILVRSPLLFPKYVCTPCVYSVLVRVPCTDYVSLYAAYWEVYVYTPDVVRCLTNAAHGQPCPGFKVGGCESVCAACWRVRSALACSDVTQKVTQRQEAYVLLATAGGSGHCSAVRPRRGGGGTMADL